MVTVDIGCGTRKEGDVGIDYYPYPGVDVVHDLTRFPWPIPNGTFDRAVSHQVIEHLPHSESVAGQDVFFAFFDEVWRILKPGGIFAFDVPHYGWPDAYCDPTHRRFYSEKAFNYFWTPERDPLYPRKPWQLVSIRTDRWYGIGGVINTWHVQKYAPRLDRLFCRLRFGVPHYIYVVLKKPEGNRS